MRIEWAPHIIPCVAMLYLMRNAGERSSGGVRDAGAGGSGERTGLGGGEVARGDTDGKEGSRNYGSYGSGPD